MSDLPQRVTPEELLQLRLLEARKENLRLQMQILDTEIAGFHARIAQTYGQRPGESLTVEFDGGRLQRAIVDPDLFAKSAGKTDVKTEESTSDSGKVDPC